jgi:hypothetical protein
MNPRHRGPDEQKSVIERTGPISAPVPHTRSPHLSHLQSVCQMRQKCQKSGSADQKDGFGTALLAHALETVADLGLLPKG